MGDEEQEHYSIPVKSYEDMAKKVAHERAKKAKQLQQDLERQQRKEKEAKLRQLKFAEELKQMGVPPGGAAGAGAAGADGRELKRVATGDEPVEAWLKAAGLPAEPMVEPVGSFVVENSYTAGAMCLILGLFYMITAFVVKTSINAYAMNEDPNNKAKDSIDTALAGTTICIIFALGLMLLGIFVIAYTYRMKKGYIRGKEVFAFNPEGSGGTWVLWAFLAMNLSIMITFIVSTVAQPWFNELENTSSYIMITVAVLTTLTTGGYVGYKLVEAKDLRESYQFTKILAQKAMAAVNAANIANNMAKMGAISRQDLERANQEALQAVSDAARAAGGLGASNVPKVDPAQTLAMQQRALQAQLVLTQNVLQSGVQQVGPAPAAAPGRSRSEAERLQKELRDAQQQLQAARSEKEEMEAYIIQELQQKEKGGGEPATAPAAPVPSAPEAPGEPGEAVVAPTPPPAAEGPRDVPLINVPNAAYPA